MSRLIDQVGLTAGVGLTDRAGLYKFGTFDPLALNPYAFFDGESYKGTLENPTLDLDPSNPDSLDVITATRSGSTATYTDSSGIIQVANPNTTRVDYVQGEQLTPAKFQRVGYTDFSSDWNNINATSQAGDGYLGQQSLIVNAPVINARTTVYEPTETGVSYTASFYVRYLNGSSGLVWMYTQFASDNQFTPITVTAEWTRVQVQFTGGSGSNVNFGVSPKVVGESVEISQPQVEEGTTATTFVANTTGSPKLITGATYGPRVPMILVEPSATNLIENSEDFSQDVTLSNCSLVSGFSAPDSSSNAFKLVEDNTNSLKLFRANNDTNTTASTSHSASIFVKAGERTKVRVYGYHLTNQKFSVDYDLNGNQFLGTNTSNSQVDGHSIEDYGDGWKRITVTGQKAATYSWDVGVSPLDDSGNVTYTGDGTSGVYIWGAQLEESSVATSLIPTSGGDAAARTRAADDLVITGSDFTDAYNASEGTFYVESSTNSDAPAYIFEASYNVGNPYENRHAAHFNASNNLKVLSRTSGNVQYGGQSLATYANNQLTRLAYSYKQSDFRVSFNGEAEPTPSGSQVPSADINQLYLGDAHITGASPLNGRIRRLIFWPYHSENL